MIQRRPTPSTVSPNGPIALLLAGLLIACSPSGGDRGDGYGGSGAASTGHGDLDEPGAGDGRPGADEDPAPTPGQGDDPDPDPDADTDPDPDPDVDPGPDPDPPPELPSHAVMVDSATGSAFDALGRAISGSLEEEGVALRQRPAYTLFWFAYSVHHRGAQVWGGAPIASGGIEPGGGCDVPRDQIRGGGPPKDGIPSIPVTGRPPAAGEAPPWVAADDPGADYLLDEDLVVGLLLDGKPSAVSHNTMFWHEIVNDHAGGGFVSITYCPLTGSGLAFVDPNRTFGTSGRLYNSNLVMYDHATDSLWSQLQRKAVCGDARGTDLMPSLAPVVETTWGRWKELYPSTRVVSDDTGWPRDYRDYPYNDFRTNDSTFFGTDPVPDDRFHPKQMVFVQFEGDTIRGYPYPAMQEGLQGAFAVINDALDGVEVVVVHEPIAVSPDHPAPQQAAWTAAFDRRLDDGRVVELSSTDR